MAMLPAVLLLLAASGPPQTSSLTTVLQARATALQHLGVHEASTLEVVGTLTGAALRGEFHTWHSPAGERYDQTTGVRSESTIRVRDHQYVVNESGNVRELHGLLLARQRTADFIDTQAFVSQPQYDRFAGPERLPDGRQAYTIVVSPPNGQPETIDIDAATSMIDRISYDNDDGLATEDYYGYRVFDGVLLPTREVDSNGDHAYDVVRDTVDVRVDKTIDRSTFAVPEPAVVATDVPVTVALTEHLGHYYVAVEIAGHKYNFLLDSGAQAVVLDPRVAAQLGLRSEGQLEVSGAQRTGGLGLAALDDIRIGGVAVPVRVVTVLDLRNVTPAYTADGILGYPFFAEAEVRLDAAASTMTFAKPGRLKADGTAFHVDNDRELVELHASIDGTDGRFVIDTGNTNELLVFAPFATTHPGVVQTAGQRFANNFGVGGSARAVSTVVNELDLGPYRLFNRNAAVMLTSQGAFADRFDAGNIGMGILRNFIVTFDLADATLYARPGPHFDDGRYRGQGQPIFP